jgi:hypothetical protein
VDATDVYNYREPELAAEAAHRQQIGFLALDLVTGRVDCWHPLWTWLRHYGAADDLAWFRERRAEPDIVGLNMYPMFSNKRLIRSPRGVRVQMTYGSPEMVEQLVELYWRQYRRPMMITETAARGPVFRRKAWLDGSVGAVRRLRERGVPLVGYTWWPMFALVAWAFRQSNRPVSDYLEQMGLWDLDPHPDADLQRVETPLVDAYAMLAASGSAAVGRLAAGATVPEARAA